MPIKGKKMKNKMVFCLSLLLLTGCNKKDATEEVKDLDRLVKYIPKTKEKKRVDVEEEKITIVKDEK